MKLLLGSVAFRARSYSCSESVKRVNSRKSRIIPAAQPRLDRFYQVRFLCFEHKSNEEKTDQIEIARAVIRESESRQQRFKAAS